MNIEIEVVPVKILNQVFQIRCPTEQKKTLVDLATELNEALKEIRKDFQAASLEQTLIIHCLNLMHAQHDSSNYEIPIPTSTSVKPQSITAIEEKISIALAKHEHREL